MPTKSTVSATREVRAEPIAALYEKRKVHHALRRAGGSDVRFHFRLRSGAGRVFTGLR
jgi:phage terminase large subunit-like protein